MAQPDRENPDQSRGFDWDAAKRLFAEALEHPPNTRDAFLAEACGGNALLHQEILSLLQSHGRGETFFEQPPASGLAIPPDPMLGKRLGPYRLLRRIGAGGMGTVYLAERADAQFRKLVALKAVRPELFNEQALRRFQNERQTLAVLDHPNIIRLLDGGATPEGVPYLVTEYVEGQPIDLHCSNNKLKVAERLQLFRAVLGAVHYAHQNLVVHRDLKPANILVTPEGVPKLLDFGIAKFLRPEYSEHAMGLTRSEMQPMTPDFASPEQVRGLPITTASDIYSLGVILYCLLACHHPFERQRRTAFELGQAICETDPERPSRTAESAGPLDRTEARALRGDLDTVVLMAMRREPGKRYASVQHFSEDIRRYLEGFPVTARQAGIWYKACKFVLRHKATTAGAVLLTAGLVATSAMALAQYRTAARRFADLRQFASFVVTNLDDALREGATPARKLMADKGLEYLDRLAREKGGDRTIMRDLVKGYLRNGDAKGNLYGATLGETAGAEQSYRKALAISEELVRAEPSNLADRQDLVTALLRLGELLAASGNRAEAMRHYDDVLRINEAIHDPGNPTEPALLQTMNLWNDMGSARSLLSDPAGALECYRRALQTAERFPASSPNKINLIAYAREQTAIHAARSGNAAGAEQAIRESIDVYQRRKPTPRARRTLAKAYKNLAEAQHLTGKLPGALASIRQSLAISEELLAADQKNAAYQIDRQQALLMEIELLNASGAAADAKAETARAMRIMLPLAAQPGAPYQHAADYAELLATTPFPELRDPAAALQYARQAADMTHRSDPEVMHVLALAYEGNGDRQRAIETADKALSLVNTGRPSLFRAMLEGEVSRLSH